ncbi:MAG: hypothetical protein Q9159_002815 [Coniocarpon cinnabarinum]
MPGTYNLDHRSSPVTLPSIHQLLKSTDRPYEPPRSRDSPKERPPPPPPPPAADSYPGYPPYHASPPYASNGIHAPRAAYPAPPPQPVTAPTSATRPSQLLPYLNAPYAPSRDLPYKPSYPLPPSQPAPVATYNVPTLNDSLKASTIRGAPNDSSSPLHPRLPSDPVDHVRESNGPGHRLSNEQLHADGPDGNRPHVNARNVVDVRQIDGDECFVLEDGSTMRTVIAGEPVNPAWGITKAGKPRKRLAKACATCREKKIKCEQGGPGDTKCVQCARLNRPCKIPQESHTPADADHKGTKRPAAGLSSGRFPPPSRSESSARQRYDQGVPHQTLNGYSTITNNRLGSQGVQSDEDWSKGKYQDLQGTQSTLERKKGRQTPRGRKFRQPPLPETANSEVFHASVDPYEADGETTLYFLDLFFHHRNASPYAIFPREHFFDWTRRCTTKSADDIMVVYALMAFGSAFSQDPRGRHIGQHCYQIAYALERDRVDQPSLQLMQARSALLLYNFARGNFEGTFEYTAHAIRTALSMRYSDENRISEVDEDRKIHDFDMNATQLKECRRRSFFVTYFIDRYNSFSYGSMGQIHDVELFLRLPMHEQDYAAGLDQTTATFGGEEVREAHDGEPSPMALLVEITSIWGDVTGNSYRSVNRVPSIYVDYYEDYFRRTKARMQAWVQSLPQHLTYSKANIQRAIQEGHFTDFYVLQAIYHLVGMKLGRTGRVDILPEEIKRRNFRMTRCYAHRFLKIIHALAEQIYKPPNDDIDLALSQPFPGYVILNACDVLSAGGKLTDLNRMTNSELNDAKMVLEQGSKFWAVNCKQCGAIDDRQGYLSALGITGGETVTDKRRIESAIDRSFLPENHDLVYKIDDELFWDVVLTMELSDEKDPLFD